MRPKSAKQLEALRESGARLSQVMAAVAQAVVPGVSTSELDRIAETEIRRLGGTPVFKGYTAGGSRPFPASICVSLNDEVVHGIPSATRLVREGDLLKIDMGLRFGGMVSDMARTFAVGRISREAQTLLDTTRESLDRGIAAIRAGARLHDYAAAVQGCVEEAGYTVVRDLVGHGVGEQLHEEPYIPNYLDKRADDFTFFPGMTVALEPMVNQGGPAVKLGTDGWTYITQDGSLSAHFEDTLIVTETGADVVTRS